MAQPPSQPGEDLTALVERTGRTLGRNTLIAGWAWTQSATVAWIILVVVLDMAVPMSVTARLAAHIGFWLVLIAAAGLTLVWPALRHPSLSEVALRIERSVGGMHNRLLTLLDLRKRNGSSTADPAMVERLVEQTRTMLSPYRIDRVASPGPVRRGLAAGGGIVIVAAALWVLFADRLPTALARVALPTADIPPASWLLLQAPGDQQVLRGEPFKAQARAVRGRTEAITLLLQPAADPKAPWVRYPMRAEEDGSFSYEVASVTEPYRYRVAADRTWTPVYTITPIPRPAVTDVSASVLLPPYMKVPEPRPVVRGEKRIVAPIGSVVRLSAAVEGDARRGQIILSRPRVTESQKSIEEEICWVEDDLPADAVTQGRWRWETGNVRSGLRSHTFNWKRETYGFRTRLYPLIVPTEGVFFTYVYLDPQDPPSQIVIHVGSGDQVRSLVWGGTIEAMEKAKPGSTRMIGKVPGTGRWLRLEAPIKQVFGASPGGVRLNGLAFSLDTGHVHFDRSGYLTRQVATVKEEVLDPAGTAPMWRGDDGRWLGDVPIDTDIGATVRFFNKLDYPSRDPSPLKIVATTDQAPTVVLERPGRDVLMAEVAAMPLLVRAFDDWGLESVGIEVGKEEKAMGQTQWLEKFDGVETTRMLLASVDPRGTALQPGQTLLYRLVARDRKGQVGRSGIYKLTLVSPPQAAAPEVARKPRPLDELRKGIASLLSPLAKIREALEGIIPDLPKDKPLTPEEARKLADERAKSLSDAQRKRLAEADKQLDQVQNRLEASARDLSKAAQESERSVLSPPLEAEVLRRLADRAGEMAAQIQPASPQDRRGREDAAAIQRLLQVQPLSQEDQSQFSDLQRKLDRAERARKDAADRPEEAGRELADVLTDIQSQQAVGQLRKLEGRLGSEKVKVDEARQRGESLREKAAHAQGAEQAAEAGKLQERAEAEARRIAAESDELLARRRVRDEDRHDERSVESPSPGHENNDARRDIGLELTDRSAELDQTRRQSELLRGRIESLRGQLRKEMVRTDGGESAPRQGSGREGGHEADPRQNANPEHRTGERLRRLLGDEEARRLLSLAQKADSPEKSEGEGRAPDGKKTPSRGQGAAGKPAPGGTALQSHPSTRPVTVLEGAELKADPQDRAAIYRLPPHIRDPLIQGMQEKGPEGYQPLIDAYYRELSKGVK